MTLMHTHPENSGSTEVATVDNAAWDRLVVIDELVIGPVRVERRRISAPYRIKLVDGGLLQFDFRAATQDLGQLGRLEEGKRTGLLLWRKSQDSFGGVGPAAEVGHERIRTATADRTRRLNRWRSGSLRCWC